MKKGKSKRVVITVILGVLLLGMVWQYAMERIDEKNYAEPGGYISTDAYEMHYVSRGEGEAAVLFITGSGTPCAYTDFYGLQEGLSAVTQTICFDHAGSGWSSETETPRTVENLENEMRQLLDEAAPDKQVILVCHSLGSLEAIYYAQQNPEQVLGIVFLDSGTPEFYRTDSEWTAAGMNRGTAVCRVTGLNRLLGVLGLTLPFYGENDRLKNLPEEVRDVDRAMFLRYAGSGETLKTIREMNENAAIVSGGPRLGSIPILVLSSDSGEKWGAVQEKLAGWSDCSRQYTLANSSHYLHWSNPEEVLLHLREFVEEVQEKIEE